MKIRVGLWCGEPLFAITQNGGTPDEAEKRRIDTLFPGWSLHSVGRSQMFSSYLYIEREVRDSEHPADVRLQGIDLVEEAVKNYDCFRRISSFDDTER